jgi:3-hydroxyisobutyrate dehydrogenase-like beta-hydroxyacid dehydrogenase
MQPVGVIGLGQMGIGIARNLAQVGFPTIGFDLRAERRELLQAAGGVAAESCAEVGARASTLFLMVMNGDQAWEALFGDGGALEGLAPGSTVIVTATILPSEVRALEQPLAEHGIDLIDSPVSGGKAGADGGALTLMAAGRAEVLERNRAALDAISKQTFHVGEEIGQGQYVKASLQSLIGCIFAATFEAFVLGAKSGVKGQTLFDVIRSSAAGSPLIETCARHVLDRSFENTGSQIGTMYKDLGISMSVAREAGAAMFATSAAYEMFQAGISRYPDGDNWVVAKWLEEIAGTEVNW